MEDDAGRRYLHIAENSRICDQWRREQALRAKLQVAFDETDRGEVSEFDAETIKREGRLRRISLDSE